MKHIYRPHFHDLSLCLRGPAYIWYQFELHYKSAINYHRSYDSKIIPSLNGNATKKIKIGSHPSAYYLSNLWCIPKRKNILGCSCANIFITKSNLVISLFCSLDFMNDNVEKQHLSFTLPIIITTNNFV